ncbi:MAG: putative transposase [Gammaproteobacteria bacterium]|jgi:putative transposase
MNTVQLQVLMLLFARWMNRSQQNVIKYLEQENQVLHEQLGGKGLLCTDSQRRRLAAKAKALGRKGLFEIRTLVTPDTSPRWYRTLIAKKYDGTMARDNPSWGYTRIRGALYNLGHEIGRNTIKRILLDNGIAPPGQEQGNLVGDLSESRLGCHRRNGLLER